MLDGTILTSLGKSQANGLEIIVSFFMFLIALLCLTGAITIVLYNLACLGFNIAFLSFQRRREAQAAYAKFFGGLGNAEN